jgi:hypothetical protein
MKAKFISLTLMVAVCLASVVAAQDSLPSRNDTAAKRTIVAPVERVTKEGSPDFVKSEERKTIFPPAGTTAMTLRHRIVTITGL